jgi:hypothetical protein
MSRIAAGAAELLEDAPSGPAVACLEGEVEEEAAAAAEASSAITTVSPSTARPALVEAAALSCARIG